MPKKSEKTKSLLVQFPEKLKLEIENMSQETGLSQTQLVVLASHSLIANYKEKGSFIFADLLDPKHRGNS